MVLDLNCLSEIRIDLLFEKKKNFRVVLRRHCTFRFSLEQLPKIITEDTCMTYHYTGIEIK